MIAAALFSLASLCAIYSLCKEDSEEDKLSFFVVSVLILHLALALYFMP